jgi:nucleoside-diphosphate-sugar epimerase
LPVLVTGATGFLGVHLLKRLLERGDQVVVLAHRGHPVPAMDRLERYLTWAGADHRIRDRLRTNVAIMKGDVVEPRFGLSTAEFRMLSDATDELWHCAAAITLRASSERPQRVNVEGTRNVLDLIESAEHPVRFFHISTVYVSGRQREGFVSESLLPDTHGFENAYVRSKHQAETMIDGWAARTRRPMCIFRTSTLVTDRPSIAGFPSHTLAVLARRLCEARAQLPSHAPKVCRWPVDPLAWMNVVPVDVVADVMVRASELPHRSPTGIFHVVNPDDVPIHTVKRALEAVSGIRLRPVPACPAMPDEYEVPTYRSVEPFFPYLAKRLRLSTRCMVDTGLLPATRTAIALPYLIRGLSSSDVFHEARTA